MLVAASAAPPFEDCQFLTGLSQITDEFAGIRIKNDCAWRHMNNEVFTISPRHLRRSALNAFLSLEFLILAKGRKCIERRLDLKDDIATLPTIAAIGSAQGDEFLAAKMHHTIATLAGFYVNYYLICKHVLIITVGTTSSD